MVVYHVVCFIPVVLLLDSTCFVAIVRIRSTTLGSSLLVRLLHGLVLFPSGISGKMTVTLDLTTIFDMLVVSMLSLCHTTYVIAWPIRDDRLLISIRNSFFSGSSFGQNSKVKRSQLGVVSGWVTNREVAPGCA